MIRFLLLLLLIPWNACADELTQYNIYIAWTYEMHQSYPIHGFRLYQEGVPVCTIFEPTSRETECIIFSEPGTYIFTMTAFFSGESGEDSSGNAYVAHEPWESKPSPKYGLNVSSDELLTPFLQMIYTLEVQ